MIITVYGGGCKNCEALLTATKEAYFSVSSLINFCSFHKLAIATELDF